VRYPAADELPEQQAEANRKAVRLERISVAYFISLIVLLYFTLGQSQAMKAAWIEDILALFPPIAFLVASRYRNRPPNRLFPFGYHRAITVAYVVSAVALFGLGLFILIDSLDKLIKGDHPPIGMVEVFDGQIWLGWLMIAALLYGLFPSLILGRMKLPLAGELHDKVLHADAKMNQADWLTAGAAIAGIVGIGFGLWWADAVAAAVISLDILHDGQKFLRESVADLMDEAPKTPDESKPHPLIDAVKREVAAAEWVDEGAVSLREHGHLITGEVRVVPRSDQDLAERLEQLTRAIHELDWRLHGIVVVAVAVLDGVPAGLRLSERGSPADS
jgi:cation diffusion facilitator family transporter